MSAHTSAHRQVLRMDIPGKWILEVKVVYVNFRSIPIMNH